MPHLDIPLPAPILEALRAAARADGVAPATWARGVLCAALGMPVPVSQQGRRTDLAKEQR